MEDRKEGSEWLSVPAFGEWEHHKGGAVPDYSVDFTKIRENRRRNKSRVSLGNEEELLTPTAAADKGGGGGEPLDGGRHRPADHRTRPSQSPARKKKILSYLNCCGRLADI